MISSSKGSVRRDSPTKPWEYETKVYKNYGDIISHIHIVVKPGNIYHLYTQAENRFKTPPQGDFRESTLSDVTNTVTVEVQPPTVTKIVDK